MSGLRHAVLMSAVAVVSSAGPTPSAPVPPPGPNSPPLKLELQADPKGYFPLVVRFVNTSREPVRVVKPLDGSEWCWVMPHYRFTVISERDREVPRSSRCGNQGFYQDTKWPNDYVVTIPPGKDFRLPVRHAHAIPESGQYRVRLEYMFTPKGNHVFGKPVPDDVWRGSVVSNTIEVELPAEQ